MLNESYYYYEFLRFFLGSRFSFFYMYKCHVDMSMVPTQALGEGEGHYTAANKKKEKNRLKEQV